MDKELRRATHLQLLKQKDYSLLDEILTLESSPLFDPDFYLERYPGIRDAGVDPYYHYCMYGWRDGLEASSEFSASAYLELNPDVAKNQINPLYHFIKYGRSENRSWVNPRICPDIAAEIARLKASQAAGIIQNKEEGKPEVVKVKDLLTQNFRDLQPIQFFMSPDPNIPAHLNFVTDALGKSLLGGVGTALILASQYAIKRGLTLRIVTRTEAPDGSCYFDFMKMMQEPVPERVEFWSDYDRNAFGEHNFRLEITPKDEFFTTSWWSTTAVKKMKLKNRIFYIIQEVEPYFYPYCDQHLWCSQQMYDSQICYMVNSHWLWEYFKKNYPVICEHGIYFDPAFPKHMYRKSKEKNHGKRKLFFYARQNHARNLYYTGLQVLDEAFRRGILNAKDWEIIFAGGNKSVVEFSNGIQASTLGQMSWTDYAKFLGTVDLTFSLMYTPHPSYPPLDTLASGGVCVTNSFENKKDNPFCKNIVFGDLSIDGLCKALQKGIQLSIDEKTRERNFKESTLPDSWSKTFQKTIEFMENF